MSDIAKRLAEPFDPSIVSFRVGPTTQDKTKGMALAYIDARDVMRRLDEVCGSENWQNDYPWSDGRRVVCRLGIKIGDEWVWKTDGAGDTDTEGEKGALSDAFKRSAVHWGIGRYLYDVDAVWVQIEQRGKSYIIAESEFPKLRARLPRAQKPTPAPVQRRVAPPSSQSAENGTGHQSAPASAPIVVHPDWWKRKDYAIDPGVIEGGMARWDAEFLACAEAAPTLDALTKLKLDNKAYHAAWYRKVAPAVSAAFGGKLASIETRLSGLEVPAITGERFAGA